MIQWVNESLRKGWLIGKSTNNFNRNYVDFILYFFHFHSFLKNYPANETIKEMNKRNKWNSRRLHENNEYEFVLANESTFVLKKKSSSQTCWHLYKIYLLILTLQMISKYWYIMYLCIKVIAYYPEKKPLLCHIRR